MYQSLYRKYRPKNFNEIYGQKVAKKILVNSIINNKISHAYLFFGPRGTGKTSIAKMFARILNCESNKNGECCEKCSNCLYSIDKNCVDIIEIDAASNNGVDEIRELKNKISLVPNKLKYKVYIIDEVHMLSTGAFNALLKTLEEPPEHIIFILATTDFYKVPETIVSRCQTIEFNYIPEMEIVQCLKNISKLEKINIEDAALNEIAVNSNGGLRDSIGLLDKLSSYVNDDLISVNHVQEVLGLITLPELKKLVEFLKNNNYSDFIKFVDKISSEGKDLIKIVNYMIKYLCNEIVENNENNNIEIIKILNNYSILMKNSINVKALFEIMGLEIINRTYVRNSDFNNTKIDSNKEANNVSKINNNYQQEINCRLNNSFVDASKTLLTEVKDKWKLLENYTFDVNFGSLCCDLLDSVPVVCGLKNFMVLVNYESTENKINENIEKYDGLVRSLLKIDKKIVAVNEKKWKNLKNEYLKKLKNNIKYEYMSLNKKTEENINDNMVNKAKGLFGDLLEN